MIYFRVTALGCKVNQYEAQAICQTLRNEGLSDWPGTGPVGLCVVHSCCITAEAARKSRQLLRRRASEHPEAAMLLSGCCALADSELEKVPKIRYVVGKGDDLAAALRLIATELHNGPVNNPAKEQHGNDAESISAGPSTVSFIRPLQRPKVKDFHGQEAPGDKDSCPPQTVTSSLDPISDFEGHNRAFVKVQDGCDRFCSYCIIPYLRSTLASRDEKEILNEVSSLLENNYREIVLCGINLGAYGFPSVKGRSTAEPAAPLAQLLDKLTALAGDSARIRISSLDPSDIYPGLVKVVADNSNICPHLHLSLQSGSDSVLERMNRNYDSAGFLNAVDMLTKTLEYPSITTDIIVGFPGESEDDFQDTVRVARAAGFSRMHIFPFSPRPGTEAASFAHEKPDKKIVRERCRQLRTLARQLSDQYTDKLSGLDARVLIEGVINYKYWGYCQRYTLVNLESNSLDAKPLTGNFVDTRYGS